MKKYVVVVAGGVGLRMKSDIPKQFLPLNGTPILMHSIDVFYRYNADIEIIVVLPQNQFDYWNELCLTHSFTIKHTLVAGGSQRFYSVQNGLTQITEQSIVAVHDAVRPLVSMSTINRCFRTAESLGNALPVIDVYESIRRVSNKGNEAIDRNLYKVVQTPQVFRSEQILSAYQLPYQPSFTDDASVVEMAGNKINLVGGNKENIKITDSIDLMIAEIVYKNMNTN